MKAATLNQKNYKLQIREVLQPVILESNVLIKLKAAALMLWSPPTTFLSQRICKAKTLEKLPLVRCTPYV